jgi:hypothetical protein
MLRNSLLKFYAQTPGAEQSGAENPGGGRS